MQAMCEGAKVRQGRSKGQCAFKVTCLPASSAFTVHLADGEGIPIIVDPKTLSQVTVCHDGCVINLSFGTTLRVREDLPAIAEKLIEQRAFASLFHKIAKLFRRPSQ